MGQKKIAKKGYTLEVVSWENDGDDFRIERKTYQDKDKAIAVAKMCKELFCSKNNGGDGVGNSMDNECYDQVVEYMKDNPELTKNHNCEDDEDLWDLCCDYSYELMDGSDFYDFRVCEKVEIYYVPDDIFVNTIDF